MRTSLSFDLEFLLDGDGPISPEEVNAHNLGRVPDSLGRDQETLDRLYAALVHELMDRISIGGVIITTGSRQTRRQALS